LSYPARVEAREAWSSDAVFEMRYTAIQRNQQNVLFCGNIIPCKKPLLNTSSSDMKLLRLDWKVLASKVAKSPVITVIGIKSSPGAAAAASSSPLNPNVETALAGDRCKINEKGRSGKYRLLLVSWKKKTESGIFR